MKTEARIEILDRLSVKHGRHIGIKNFEELIQFCDSKLIIIVVRLAMAEYYLQGVEK